MGRAMRNGNKRVTDEFFCECGGRIMMVTIVRGGSLRHMARCDKCGTEKRKPKDFA